ncbi:hypothetical protein [Cryptosporangium minutisporangium]|uniref:Uncharacterized protein n=1 Tax=Cryptosporangium minutisporangium TaxID=113569 RepID=A0ABP6SYT2_9ACTN
MFDPVSFVVLALVNGILNTVAQKAATEGYGAFKRYLTQRYGTEVEVSVAQLEKNPRSLEYQSDLAWRLRTAGADNDPELMRLARELTDLVENPERSSHSEAVVTDPVADLRRTTGMKVVSGLLEEHLSKVLAVRSRHLVEDRDLLSGNIKGSAAEVPLAIRDSATQLRHRMRQVIQQISTTIEESRYREVEAAVEEFPAGLAERQRADRLVQADKLLHISYESLRVTVEFFSEINRSVLSRIEEEQSRSRQANMMFGNAVMIYELTDFVIGYIRSFTLGGDLEGLRADAKKRVDDARRAEKEFAARIREREVEVGVLEQTLADIRAREEALDLLDREWDRYLGEMGDMRGRIDEVRRSIPTLETIRENAERQITALQLVAMLNFLKQSSDSIRPTVDTLQGFRLAPLNESRVRRLLGM